MIEDAGKVQRGNQRKSLRGRKVWKAPRGRSHAVMVS